MDDAPTVCERIRVTRETQGLSLAHCARLIGWKSPNAWRRLENDDRRVQLDELTVIAKILGVTVAFLYGERPILLPLYRHSGRPKKITGGTADGLAK
ncbi:MAG: helix-turn-helix transcriptional regulator [Deltaproteobacteria bacterium]|nr:helix-turn-helix transcriptional regulator [Deltaproteobacteria bacterium]